MFHPDTIGEGFSPTAGHKTASTYIRIPYLFKIYIYMLVWLILHERIADDLSFLYFTYIIILIFKCIICVIKQVCFSIIVTIHLDPQELF